MKDAVWPDSVEFQVEESDTGNAILINTHAFIGESLGGSAAAEAGVSHFDTAPFYGFGLSERRVGDMLRGREGFVLSTNVERFCRTRLSR